MRNCAAAKQCLCRVNGRHRLENSRPACVRVTDMAALAWNPARRKKTFVVFWKVLRNTRRRGDKWETTSERQLENNTGRPHLGAGGRQLHSKRRNLGSKWKKSRRFRPSLEDNWELWGTKVPRFPRPCRNPAHA